MGDQTETETSVWQQKILAPDSYPSLRLDSNPEDLKTTVFCANILLFFPMAQDPIVGQGLSL